MWIRHLLSVLAVASLLTTPTLAATVDPAPETNQWVPMVLAMVLVICVLTLSFLGSRRGHQD